MPASESIIQIRDTVRKTGTIQNNTKNHRTLTHTKTLQPLLSTKLGKCSEINILHSTTVNRRYTTFGMLLRYVLEDNLYLEGSVQHSASFRIAVDDQARLDPYT